MRTTAPLRINYAIFGNLEPALHAHIVPRYRHEPESLRTRHPWAYDWTKAPAFDAAAAAPLMKALRVELAHLGTLRTP
jgi:diadenosine tetraphosphate (Ap4A) HIT family hydrolase